MVRQVELNNMSEYIIFEVYISKIYLVKYMMNLRIFYIILNKSSIGFILEIHYLLSISML